MYMRSVVLFLILSFHQLVFAAFPSSELYEWQSNLQKYLRGCTDESDSLKAAQEIVKVITKNREYVSHSNIATGFLTLGKISFKNPTLNIKDFKKTQDFSDLIGLLRSKMGDMDTKVLVNILVGLVKIDYYSQDLFHEMVDSINRALSFSANSKDVLQTLWALGRKKHYSEKLFSTLQKIIIQEIEKKAFNSQELSDISFAFAINRHYSKRLFNSLKEELIKKIKEEDFTSKQITNIAWSFAKMNHYSKRLFKILKEQSFKKIEQDGFEVKELTNLAWAFGVFDEKRILKKILRYFKDNDSLLEEFSFKGKTQILQVAFLFKDKYRKLIEKIGPIGDLVLHTSSMQRNIFTVLQGLHTGFSFSEEEEVVRGCTVDIAIRQKKVAIEVDGFSHYARNSRRKNYLLGQNSIKENILKSNGWELIRIPYFIWSEKGETEREEYLRRLLRLKRKR